MEHSAEIAEVGIYSGLQKNWTFCQITTQIGLIWGKIAYLKSASMPLFSEVQTDMT